MQCSAAQCSAAVWLLARLNNPPIQPSSTTAHSLLPLSPHLPPLAIIHTPPLALPPAALWACHSFGPLLRWLCAVHARSCCLRRIPDV